MRSVAFGPHEPHTDTGALTLLGSLVTAPVRQHPELVASVVHAELERLGLLDEAQVAAIDPTASDTAAFCARYGVGEDVSANCVVVQGRRGAQSSICAGVVLATTRLDVNGAVRRRLDAKKASFAPMELAVEASSMAYGAITPIGLPEDWPVLVDAAVAKAGLVVVGSGKRESKLVLDGGLLASLPRAELIEALALPRG